MGRSGEPVGSARTSLAIGVSIPLSFRCGSFYRSRMSHPYDGRTLKEVIEETEALTGREIERAYVDKGYVGHKAPKPGRRSGQKRGGQIKKATAATIRHRTRHRKAISAATSCTLASETGSTPS